MLRKVTKNRCICGRFRIQLRRWRQPPGTLGQIDPCQLWAVEVSAAALEQSGYDGESKDFDRSKCGVILLTL